MDALNSVHRTHHPARSYLSPLAISIATAIAGVLLTAPRSATAQGARPTPPTITWCDATAKKPEWLEQTVYLSLIEGDPGGMTRLSPDALQDVLISVAMQIRALPALQANGNVASGPLVMPSATGVYSPGALLGDVVFQMTPDGKVGRISFHDTRDTALAHDIRTALKSVSASAPKADADSTVYYHSFLLAFSFTTSPLFPTFPLFKLFAPVSHNVQMVKRSRRQIPPGFENWDVGLRLSFFVDTAGKIEHGSVRPIPPPESIVFKNKEQQQVFLSYVNTATLMFEESQYKAAEFLGCRVRQEISYSVNYKG